MSIIIGKHEFEGPYTSVADLEEKQGLYAVLHCQGEEYDLLHVAEADNVRDRITLSQSAYASFTGSILLAACYTPQSGSRERSAMVEDIQREFNDESSLELCSQAPMRIPCE